MTVPVDPGTGLLDLVDYIYLAGGTGLHARFLELYKTFDPAQRGIQQDNILMSGIFDFTGDGTLRQKGLNVLHPLARVTGIDGKVVATTNLLTVPAGKTLFPFGGCLRLTTVTALVGQLTAGMGVAAGEDDIFASTPMVGFNALNEIYWFLNSGVGRSVPAGSIVKLGIDTAFTGTTATLEAFLFGFYI